MATTVTVREFPPCDFCKEQGHEVEAHYDGKTKLGPWAFMCNGHFTIYGVGLGTGLGQRLVLKEDSNG